MAFMRKIESDIILNEVEALVLYRANELFERKEKGAGSPAETLGNYIYTLHKKLVENGSITESYEEFEDKWFCNYYDEEEDISLDGLYADMIYKLLGNNKISEMASYDEFKHMIEGISFDEDIDEEKLDMAANLIERINKDISRIEKGK